MTAIWKGAHSSNFQAGRPNGHRPRAIVIHIMDGSLVGTDSWFNDRASGVSAHYGIGKAGTVHQYVRETDTAFHAGTVVRPTWPLLKPGINPNYYTIGIEHEGFGGPGTSWPKGMLEASVALVGDIARRWGIPLDADHIIPHRAIRATKPHCPGRGVDLGAYLAHVAAAPRAAEPAEETIASFTARIVSNAYVRREPRRDTVPLRTLLPGDGFPVVAVARGEDVSGNDRWLRNPAGEYLWAGNTDRPLGSLRG
jgi:N-acetyl-anhydromuramyl-L-alanine amidase AmpD